MNLKKPRRILSIWPASVAVVRIGYFVVILVVSVMAVDVVGGCERGRLIKLEQLMFGQ